MGVLGIDIGNENSVVAVVVKLTGAVHILPNDESKYETPSSLTFAKKKRQIGSTANSTLTSQLQYSKSTISQIKRLVGKQFEDLDMDNELQFLPFGITEAEDGGILIHVNYLDEDREYTPVQILAMLLSHLKQTAERNLGLPVSDCVIGIPSYFSDRQRIAYLDAAKIAELNPLQLMHDGTAIALGYGFNKSSEIKESPIYVVFVDVGHCDTQVTVASFHAQGVRILSHASDRNLGGRDFDRLLFNNFAEEFRTQYGLDIGCHHHRPGVRLMTACEKLKRVLSTNSETHITIEGLMEDKDMHGCITREDFEELSVDLLERIVVSCEKALVDAGLTVYDIYSIELVGSGSRIPAISRILAEFFRRVPSRQLNASQCVARGCALQPALLGQNSRIKKYVVSDSIPFPVWFIGKSSDGMVLTKGHTMPQPIVLTFRRKTRPFFFNILCGYESDMCHSSFSKSVRCFKVGSFKLKRNELAYVDVKILLNANGTITVEGATVNKVTMMDGMMYHDCKNIGVSEVSPVEMTEDDIDQAKAIEKWLTGHDISVEEAQQSKNDLESFVYDTRKKLAGKYRNFATKTEKETISLILRKLEEWLDEDEDDDEYDEIHSLQFEKLHELINRVEKRYENQVDAEPDIN